MLDSGCSMLGVDVAVIYYASTAIRMRNVRYLLASENVMWYNCFIRGKGRKAAKAQRFRGTEWERFKETKVQSGFISFFVPLCLKLSALADSS
jgi:hypothetical protein